MSNTIMITNKLDLPDDYYKVEIDAKAAQTLTEFYNACAKAFHFPTYFKPNPEAFRDTLENYDDFAGHTKNVAFVIKNAQTLLAGEIYKSVMLHDHLAIFNQVALHWAKKKDSDGTTKIPRDLKVILQVNNTAAFDSQLIIRMIEELPA